MRLDAGNKWWRQFWWQPCRRYRNFQLVFALLSANFIFPAVTYTVAPEVAVDQFLTVNRLLGGAPYLFPEAASRVWRYLGAANVMTLGLMCLLLQLDLRRFRAVLVPLTFMKAYAALLWWAGWLAAPQYRFFLAAAVLDTITSAAFLYFGGGAARAIAGHSDAELVPRPLGGST
jgi:hypothetical protein